MPESVSSDSSASPFKAYCHAPREVFTRNPVSAATPSTNSRNSISTSAPQVIDKRGEKPHRSSSSISVRQTTNVKEQIVHSHICRDNSPQISTTPADSGQASEGDLEENFLEVETIPTGVINRSGVLLPNDGEFNFSCPPQEIHINMDSRRQPPGSNSTAAAADYQPMAFVDSPTSRETSPVQRTRRSHRVKTHGNSDATMHKHIEHEKTPCGKVVISESTRVSSASDPGRIASSSLNKNSQPNASPTAEAIESPTVSTDGLNNHSPPSESVASSPTNTIVRSHFHRGSSPGNAHKVSQKSATYNPNSRTTRAAHHITVLPNKKDTIFKAPSHRAISSDSLVAGDESSGIGGIATKGNNKDDSPHSSLLFGGDALFQRTPRPPHPYIRKNSTSGSNVSLVEAPSAAEDDTDENTIVDNPVEPISSHSPVSVFEKAPDSTSQGLPPKRLILGYNKNKVITRTGSTGMPRQRPLPSRYLMKGDGIQPPHHDSNMTNTRGEEGPSDEGGESNVEEERTSPILRRYQSLRSMASNEVLNITGGLAKQSILANGNDVNIACGSTGTISTKIQSASVATAGGAVPKIYYRPMDGSTQNSQASNSVARSSPPKVTFNVPETNDGERRKASSFRHSRKKHTRPYPQEGAPQGPNGDPPSEQSSSSHPNETGIETGSSESGYPMYREIETLPTSRTQRHHSHSLSSSAGPISSSNQHHHQHHHQQQLQHHIPQATSSSSKHSSNTDGKNVCTPQSCAKVHEQFLDQMAYYMRSQLDHMLQFQEGKFSWDTYRQMTLQALRVQEHSVQYLIQEFEKSSSADLPRYSPSHIQP